MLLQAEKLEDPDESLFVFFPEAERQSGEVKKVGVKPIHKCCQKMKDQGVSKAILVVEVCCVIVGIVVLWIFARLVLLLLLAKR